MPHNCAKQNKVRQACKVIDLEQDPVVDLYTDMVLAKADSIIKDSSHLLKSSARHQGSQCILQRNRKTKRYRDSFIHTPIRMNDSYFGPFST